MSHKIDQHNHLKSKYNKFGKYNNLDLMYSIDIILVALMLRGHTNNM